jgi:hypothetical protein
LYKYIARIKKFIKQTKYYANYIFLPRSISIGGTALDAVLYLVNVQTEVTDSFELLKASSAGREIWSIL